MNRTLKILLPLAVLAVGLAGAAALISARPDVATVRPDVPAPLVRVMEARTGSTRLKVHTQGTVAPRTSSVLIPEVAGRILEASPSFVAGGFFEKGEMLLRIDPRDYELAVVRAGSRVAEARVALQREEEEAAVARREWESLGSGEPTPLVLREPQLEEARAALEAALADLDRARIDLERTSIVAPFAGRVREKMVDIGQYVTPGTQLARLYAVDYAEVRLPIPDADLAFVDIPLDYRGDSDRSRGPEVLLQADFAGRTHAWQGRIVRTEGELDPRSRMVHVVARVADPYGRGDDPDRPPLAVGMFVRAEIQGREVSDVVVLPRSAMRGDTQVLVVDGEDRLRFRDVEVLQANREHVIVAGGLADGDRICLSNVEAAVDGMKVRTS